jgi:hypothetical protein
VIPLVVAAVASACQFGAGGALPDHHCTPGALNPAVTQATIDQTICVRGWTATIRPSDSVTEPEKLASMARYGVTNPRLYEYDHLIPLELGGAPNDLRNLWPEPHHLTSAGKSVGSFVKDSIENYLRARVCNGTITLARARAIIRGDWRKVIPAGS